MRMLRGSAVISLFVVGLAACAQILGNDFTVGDDDEGGGGSGLQGGGPTTSSTTDGGGGASAVGTPCDPGAQDCPAPLTCVVVAADEGVCAAPGQVGEGGPCGTSHPPDSTSECVEGHVCHEGTCRALCEPEAASPCPSEHACLTISSGYSWCEPWCDPFVQDCGGDDGCYALPFDGGAHFVCAPSQGVATGSPCNYVNDCVVGATCIPNLPSCNGAACCAAFCLTNDDCPAPMTCIPVTGFPNGLGVCWY